jgi:hypothetical protein
MAARSAQRSVPIGDHPRVQPNRRITRSPRAYRRTSVRNSSHTLAQLRRRYNRPQPVQRARLLQSIGRF